MKPTVTVSKKGDALMKFVRVPRTKEYQDSLEPDSYVMPHRAKENEVEFLKSEIADLKADMTEIKSNLSELKAILLAIGRSI